jgi:E3 ubiquitin-protein ligase listerin
MGFLNAFSEPLAASKFCERICNEIVTDLTYSSIEQKEDQIFRSLIVLNLMFDNQDGLGQTIAKPRLVSFVKHVVPWLHEEAVSLALRAEICKALVVLLPLMSDIYDSLWGNILEAISESWSKIEVLKDDGTDNSNSIPFAHASLKLYAQIRALTSEEDPNDDLVDAWKDSEEKTSKELIQLLKHTQHFPDEFHQPLKVVNNLLARQLSKVPLKHLESAEDLYPLLYVDSQPVQQIAFNMLHKQIAAAQEQISIDAAIGKKTVRLPEELLSLILEAPSLVALADADFDRDVPLPLRGYLLSWVLVFDHLQHAVSALDHSKVLVLEKSANYV